MNNPARVPVLMYHRVGEPDHARDVYCIRPDRFSAQMRALAYAGYQAVGIDAFQAWRLGRGTLPENAFVLTFDDGFTGVYEFVAPLLRDMGWPATVFVVGDRIGGLSDWQVTVDEPMRPHPLMNEAQLKELAAQGFSLHSHSFRHHDLTTLDEAALRDDLQRSREAVARLAGQAPDYLAYPYGRHNEMVRAVAEQMGFLTAFSVEPGFNQPGGDAYRIRRLDVFGSDSPAMLLRKIRLGSNDGRLTALLRYYTQRLFKMT